MNTKLHFTQALFFSLFLAVSSLLLPHRAHANTYFLDEFNGNNTTLEQYNSAYQAWVGQVYVSTDHAYTSNGYGAFTIYTGLSQSDNCTSMDFRSDGWVSILLRTTSDFSQMDRIDLVDGSWWRYFHNGQSISQQNLDPLLTFDRFSPTIHTLKACASGTTLVER